MKNILILLFLLPALASFAQTLPRVVKKINPALFVNNMDNERVYQQANIRENLVVFSRGFENRNIEEVQQSFHYCFMDEKTQEWILELQFDRHEIKVSGDGMDPVNCSDFGFKIYNKKKEIWKEVTLESLPKDFLVRITKELPELQKGSRGMYFYNQEPERAVHVEVEKNRLNLKQNGTTVLSLQWKKEAFDWKK